MDHIKLNIPQTELIFPFQTCSSLHLQSSQMSPPATPSPKPESKDSSLTFHHSLRQHPLSSYTPLVPIINLPSVTLCSTEQNSCFILFEWAQIWLSPCFQRNIYKTQDWICLLQLTTLQEFSWFETPQSLLAPTFSSPDIHGLPGTLCFSQPLAFPGTCLAISSLQGFVLLLLLPTIAFNSFITWQIATYLSRLGSNTIQPLVGINFSLSSVQISTIALSTLCCTLLL